MIPLRTLPLLLAATVPACDARDSLPAAPAVVASVNPGAPGPDLRAERAELLAADRAYADASGRTNVVEGLTAMLAPSVIFVLGPNHVIGADAVRAALEANPANRTLVQRWTPIRVDVSSDGRHGYTYGYTELVRPDGVVLPGKYLAYWVRQADGRWKVAAYKRGGRPAGDVSATPPAGFESPDYAHYRIFPHAGRDAEITRVRQADQAFSDLAERIGTGAAFRQYIAPDGAGFGAFPSMSFGTDMIVASYDPFPAGGLIWSPEYADVSASADLAFTTGGFLIRERRPDGSWAVVGAGKYLTVWKRQRNDQWLFVIDG